MVVINCVLSEEAVRVINVVKAQKSLSNQDKALDKILLEYGKDKGIK